MTASSLPLRRLGLLLALGLAGPGLLGQSSEETPLRNFRLPVFDAQGNRIFDLSSREFRTLDDEPLRLALTTVHVRMYAVEDKGALTGQLFAPEAVYDQSTEQVSGRGQLHAIYRNVELFGDDWTYHAPEKRLVIERNVVVTFPGQLGDVLQ